MSKYKALFHLDEPDRTRMVLNNIKNLLDDMNNVEVEVVVNATAVEVLQEQSEYKNIIEKLDKREVSFKACSNSLENFDVKEKDLINAVEVVSAGVTELTVKQSEGWAYIRP